MMGKLADAVEQMAAPIYAALLAHYLSLGPDAGMPSQEKLAILRFAAIDHAVALHREVLLTPSRD